MLFVIGRGEMITKLSNTQVFLFFQVQLFMFIHTYVVNSLIKQMYFLK